MTDLKPCPFCGYNDMEDCVQAVPSVWMFTCRKCKMQVIISADSADAARAKYNTRAAQWQPIETYNPKEHPREVLISYEEGGCRSSTVAWWNREARHLDCYYIDPHGNKMTPSEFHDACEDGAVTRENDHEYKFVERFQAGWVDGTKEGPYYDALYRIFTPTHWMPLPAPPEVRR